MEDRGLGGLVVGANRGGFTCIGNASVTDSTSDVRLQFECVRETAFPESAGTVHDLGGPFHHGVQGRGGGGYQGLRSVGFSVR